MINKIKLLSKSSTSRWITAGATLVTILVANQTTIVSLVDGLFGGGVGSLVSQILPIATAIITAIGGNVGRLNAETKTPLAQRL